MYTFEERASTVQQPKEGYLEPWAMEQIGLVDDKVLSPNENIDREILNIVVRNLARVMMGDTPEDAFADSLYGASIVEQTYELVGAIDESIAIASVIYELSDENIKKSLKTRNLFAICGKFCDC